MGDISMTVLAVMAVLAVVAHVALLISSRWLNLLMVLVATFCVLSPFSGAPEFPLVGVAKYGRIYVTLLMVIIGFGVYRIWRFKPTAIVFLVFVGFFTLASIWSGAVVSALLYKGLYFALVVAGLFAGYSLRGFDDLKDGMRLITLSGAVFALFIMLELVKNPSAISHVGRLAAWGMNGNRIGQTAAPMLVLCTYVALYDPVKLWKIVGFGVCTVLGVIIIYTASRGAAGEAAIGCFILAMPLMRRPVLWAFVCALGLSAAFIALSMIELDTTERFFDYSLDTRANPWSEAMYLAQDSPVFGTGWHFKIEGGSPNTENLHSIYFQTLVETGFFGLALLMLVTIVVLAKSFWAWREMRGLGIETHTIFLPISIVVATLAHGAFESAPITGGMIGALILPIALAMLDRIPELARATAEEMDWEEATDEAYDGEWDDFHAHPHLTPGTTS